MTPLDKEVQAAVMALPDHIRAKLFVEPDLEQDDGDVTLRAYTADGEGVVSYAIRRNEVIVVRSRLNGTAFDTENYPHTAFDGGPDAEVRFEESHFVQQWNEEHKRWDDIDMGRGDVRQYRGEDGLRLARLAVEREGSRPDARRLRIQRSRRTIIHAQDIVT